MQWTPVTNPSRVKIKNGAQIKRCEIDRLLTKGFTQIFKEKHHKRKKVKRQIRKIASQKKHPMENPRKIWVYTSHLIFMKELSRFLKIVFSRERVYGRIFLTEFGGTFFAGLYPDLFSLAKEKIHREKNLADTQSMKIQVKSGEIPVCKNVGKIMQNVGSRRLTPKSAKLTC